MCCLYGRNTAGQVPVVQNSFLSDRTVACVPQIYDRGVYEIQRGDASCPVHDDPEILEAFSRMAHDMPAESLAYAVLADRALWGMDLREIDGLEMRVCFDISSIQRIGLRETMRLQDENA